MPRGSGMPPTRRRRRPNGDAAYPKLSTLCRMLGGVAPAEAIRVFRENGWMAQIPAMRDFDPDRAESGIRHHKPGPDIEALLRRKLAVHAIEPGIRQRESHPLTCQRASPAISNWQ